MSLNWPKSLCGVTAHPLLQIKRKEKKKKNNIQN